MNDGTFEQFVEALKKAPRLDNLSELTAWLADEMTAVDAQDRKPILAALTSLFRVQHHAGVSPSRFVEDVWDSLSGAAPNLFRASDELILKSRLALLIEQTSLDLSSVKLSDVRSEVERSYCGARILTDLRPAFRDDIDEVPTAMALMHTLQLGYHDDTGRHHEFYVTLDGSDLEQLKQVIERAGVKAKTLSRGMSKSGITLT